MVGRWGCDHELYLFISLVLLQRIQSELLESGPKRHPGKVVKPIPGAVVAGLQKSLQKSPRGPAPASIMSDRAGRRYLPMAETRSTRSRMNQTPGLSIKPEGPNIW